VLHLWAAGASLIAGPALCLAAADRAGGRAQVGCAIYAVALCALFTVSALFHRITWSRRAYLTMKRIDHAMIFVFIAGCYTGFCLVLLDSRLATGLIAVVWGGALIGVVLKVAWPRAPRWLGFAPYVILGWIPVALVPDFLVQRGPLTVGLLLGGGVIYILGGACWAMRWPNPWPRTFAHHEIFHALAVIAAAIHYAAIYTAL
jgi:hemolysin III